MFTAFSTKAILNRLLSPRNNSAIIRLVTPHLFQHTIMFMNVIFQSIMTNVASLILLVLLALLIHLTYKSQPTNHSPFTSTTVVHYLRFLIEIITLQELIRFKHNNLTVINVIIVIHLANNILVNRYLLLFNQIKLLTRNNIYSFVLFNSLILIYSPFKSHIYSIFLLLTVDICLKQII